MVSDMNNRFPSSYKEALEFAEKADKKLLIGDKNEGEVVFDPNSLVMIEHEEGTILFYGSAFIRRYRDYFCIFTEHHGVHVYHQEDVVRCNQYNKLQNPRPKLKGSDKKDYCDDCKKEFSVDDLEYRKHPGAEHWEDSVALCPECLKKAME